MIIFFLPGFAEKGSLSGTLYAGPMFFPAPYAGAFFIPLVFSDASRPQLEGNLPSPLEPFGLFFSTRNPGPPWSVLTSSFPLVCRLSFPPLRTVKTAFLSFFRSLVTVFSFLPTRSFAFFPPLSDFLLYYKPRTSLRERDFPLGLSIFPLWKPFLFAPYLTATRTSSLFRHRTVCPPF